MARRRLIDKPRRAAAFQLDRVRRGLDPDDWKPMTSIGQGVREIRVRDASGQFRVIYIASSPEAVYVLHAFQKSKADNETPPEVTRRIARINRL